MNTAKNDRLLFPSYGNIIAVVAIGLGVLIAFQSILSWRVIEKESAGYILQFCILIGFLFFVISKHALNVRADMEGRLKAYMGTMVYGVVIVVLNPFISYFLRDGQFEYNMSLVALISNLCIFYFVMLFPSSESSPKKEKRKAAHSD